MIETATALSQDLAGRVAGWSFVLATDLDGTFLGGSPRDRARLYHWINTHREKVGLVFLTGRDPSSIESLCTEGPVPWPDAVIADLGTTIAEMAPAGPGGTLRPIPALEAELAALWGEAGDTVRARLDGLGGLSLQPGTDRYRLRYAYDPVAADPQAAQIVEEVGLDHVIIHNRLFDVVPKGVSTVASLKRLIGHLGVRENRVLAAGSRYDALSLLSAGFPSVAVGGSEAALLSALPDHPFILRAEGTGAAGIIDAIAHFGLHSSPPR